MASTGVAHVADAVIEVEIYYFYYASSPTRQTPISAQPSGGRGREGEPVMRASACVDRASPRGVSRSQRWGGGGIALLVFMTFGSAWVLLIGFRPCALASLWWR